MARVYVLAPGNERGGAATHLVTYARVLHRSGYSRAIEFVMLGGGHLADHLRESCVGAHFLPAHPARAVSALAALLRQSSQPCLLHAHGPRANLLACLGAGASRRLWTSTVHSHPDQDFLASRWKSAVLPKVNRFCLQRAAGLFVVHPKLAECFPGKRTWFVPNAVPLEPLPDDHTYYRRRLRERLGIPADSAVVGVAARLDPVKDIGTTVRALAALDHAGVHLAIAGDGPERQRLEALAAALGVRDRVHFLGFVDNVQAFYAGLDVHVLSSLSEGTPSSLLEAGAAGVPNVGTDIPGITHLVSHGQTGMIVPVGDPVTLAATLDQLLKDPVRRRLLAERFAREVLPRFAPEQMLRAYVEGYRQLLGVHFTENAV
ncbi:MAG: glycosyltransferase family 4 protein [Alicyclobacillaceae bacterium]|nr:glycosyltransferase family 4 protein [Alicyclobacillaceae bacterium]